MRDDLAQVDTLLESLPYTPGPTIPRSHLIYNNFPARRFLYLLYAEARLREMLAGLANPASSRSRTRQLPEGIGKKQIAA
jgi:hypothetical protein